MKTMNLNMLYVVGYVVKRQRVFHRLYREPSWLVFRRGIVLTNSRSGRNGVGHGLRHKLTPSPCGKAISTGS